MNFFFIFLIIFIPISYLFGPFLVELTLILLSLLFLFNALKKRKFYYFNNYFFKIFIIWYIYILISSFSSVNVDLSITSSLFYFRFGLYALAIYYVLNEYKNSLNFLSASFLFVFILFIFDGYFQYIFGFNLLGYEKIGVRISSFFGDELVLGSFLSRFFPIFFVFSFILFKKYNIKLYYLFFLLIACDVLIYLTGERTAFGILAISTLMLLFSFKGYKLFRIATIIVSTLIISLITFSDKEVRTRMISTTINDMQTSSVNEANNVDQINELDIKENKQNTENAFSIFLNSIKNKYVIFTPAHNSLYMSAIDLYLQSDSKLIGEGPKLFRYLCKINSEYLTSKHGMHTCSTHPHHLYIQILLETGLLGLMFSITIFFYIFYKIIKLSFEKNFNISTNIAIASLICIFSNFFPFFPSGSFFNNWLNTIFFIPIGVYLYATHKKNI